MLKISSENILGELGQPGESNSHDSSTSGLINAFKKRSAL
jgi:glucose-6-phosphate isomerase